MGRVEIPRCTAYDRRRFDRRVRSRRGGRSPYAVRSEADDIGLSIPSDVGQLARVGVVAVPTAGIGTKGRELEWRRCKVPACGGQGYRDAVSAEADDVGEAVGVNVRKHARVEVLAGPAAGVGPEGGKFERGHRKMPASGVQGHINAVSAETDDVGPAVPVNVGKFARVGVVAAPAAGR